MSAERRPSFSDIVFTLEGMDREEDGEKPIALGKNIKSALSFEKTQTISVHIVALTRGYMINVRNF